MSSIPLPALHVNPPQPQESPLDSIARLMQIKSAAGQQQLQQQQIQAGQQENQMRTMELQDQMKMRSLAPNFVQKSEDGKVTGYDTDGYFNGLLSSGVNPAKIAAMRNQYAEAQKNIAAAGSAKIKLQEETNNQAYQILEGVRTAMKTGPDAAQAAYQQAVPKLQGLGMDVSKFPPQFPGEDGLTQFEVGLGVHKQMLEDAKTLAETNQAGARADEAKANTLLAQSKAKWAAANGMPVGVPASDIQMADWLKKNPGKGPSDYEIAMKKVVPAYNFNLQTTGGSAGGNGAVDWAAEAKRMGMSQAALDQSAEKYFSTGQLPPAGRGIAGGPTNKLIMNRAAALHPDGNLAANSAEFKANEKSLEGLQKNFDQVSAFEATARRNIDLLETTAQKIPDLGVRFADTPVRMVSAKLVGDPNMAAFKTALNTAQTESAKVLNSANANGVLSDSARHDLQDVIDGNLPLKSMVRVLDTLRQDMSNRHVSYQEQIDDIKKRLGGRSSAQPGNAEPNAGGSIRIERDAAGRIVSVH